MDARLGGVSLEECLTLFEIGCLCHERSWVEEEGCRQGECRDEVFGGWKFHKNEGDGRDLVNGKQKQSERLPLKFADDDAGIVSAEAKRVA